VGRTAGGERNVEFSEKMAGDVGEGDVANVKRRENGVLLIEKGVQSRGRRRSSRSASGGKGQRGWRRTSREEAGG